MLIVQWRLPEVRLETGVGHLRLTESNICSNSKKLNIIKKLEKDINNEINIKYIGQTSRSLKERMYGYKNPGPTQTTNIYVNKQIKNEFKQDNLVVIYSWQPNHTLNYNGLEIDLTKGLEDALINHFNLKNDGWNRK